VLQSVAAFALELGGMNFSRQFSAAPHIVTVAPGPRFFRLSGGVAFTQTATGKDGWAVTRLTYDAARPDGQRLVAHVSHGGKSMDVNTGAYDWEIGPLVRYVAADETNAGQSVVTLFGKLQDRKAEEQVLRDGHMVINFHPAFQNTLLGLRLLQADLMLFEVRAAELFRENGQDILGAGEPRPDGAFASANRERYRTIQKWLADNNIEWESYVAGDIGQPSQFYVDSGELRFTGAPYWALWRDTPQANEAQRAHARASAMTARAKLPLEDARISVALDHGAFFAWLDDARAEGSPAQAATALAGQPEFVKRSESFFADLRALYRSHPAGKPLLDAKNNYAPAAKARAEIALAMLARLETMSPSEWTKRRDALNNMISVSALQRRALDLPIDVDANASGAVSSRIRQEAGINPIVYRALQRAMNYSALLRHYRVENPSGFQALVAATRSVDVSPAAPRGLKVLTPTVYPRGRDAR
jgi:hypothetical protein